MIAEIRVGAHILARISATKLRDADCRELEQNPSWLRVHTNDVRRTLYLTYHQNHAYKFEPKRLKPRLDRAGRD